MKCLENGDFDIVYFLDRLSNFEMRQTMRVGVTGPVYNFLVLMTGFNLKFTLNLWGLKITASNKLVRFEQGHAM